VKQLSRNFEANPKRFYEATPDAAHTSYSVNKGEAVHFCLREREGKNETLVKEDIVTFVSIHEMGHMIWAFGSKKNWPKLRGQKVTPAQRRQEEYDADVYGLRLAMQLGYDRRKAWDHFTVAIQREPFDPKFPTYPSVGQRKANVEKDVKSSADAQAQQKAAEPAAQEPAPKQPNPDMAEKNAWLNHIMQGMRKFEVALAQDPNLAQA
jgi:hypothetical protein